MSHVVPSWGHTRVPFYCAEHKPEERNIRPYKGDAEAWAALAAHRARLAAQPLPEGDVQVQLESRARAESETP